MGINESDLNSFRDKFGSSSDRKEITSEEGKQMLKKEVTSVKSLYPYNEWLKVLKSIRTNDMLRSDNFVVPPKKGILRISPELDELYERIKHIEKAEDCKTEIKRLFNEEKLCKEVDTSLIDEDIWFNTTKKTINLRPGGFSARPETSNPGIDDFKPNKTDPTPLCIGDENVHGVVAGRTGGGKSVALNTMLCNLFYEYAPWEININLADFKLVEMSKYANFMDTPHIKIVAATTSMEFVASVIYEMYDKMLKRQDFLAKLGLAKIEDYRDEFGVVLPREILVVDEFQYLYTLANARQEENINTMITAITKLGRATGFHLVFASQSMTGTISADTLANFKIKMCLPADASISATVLGNAEAGKLVGKGKMLANTSGGAIEDNMLFWVPFLDSENKYTESDIEKKGIEKELIGLTQVQGIIKKMCMEADKVGYKKGLKFYQEDYRRKMSELESNFKVFRNNSLDDIEADSEMDSMILLGDSTVYTTNKNSTLEFLKIKNGDKKNIMCIADSAPQKSYLSMLLARQFKHMKTDRNFYIEGDAVLRDYYDINTDIKFEEKIHKKNFLGEIEHMLNVRKTFVEFSESEKKYEDLITICLKNKMFGSVKTLETLMEEFPTCFDKDLKIGSCYNKMGTVTEGGIEFTEEDLARKNEFKVNVDSILRTYYSFEREGKFSVKNMPMINYWLLGFNKVDCMLSDERSSSKTESLLKICTTYRIRVIAIGGAVKDLSKSMCRNFAYVFLNTGREDNFTMFDLNKPKNFKDGVVIIKSDEPVRTADVTCYILQEDVHMVKKFAVDIKEVKEKDYFIGLVS